MKIGLEKHIFSERNTHFQINFTDAILNENELFNLIIMQLK